MLTGYPLSCTLGCSVLGIGSEVARFLMTAEYATYRYLRCVVNVMRKIFKFSQYMHINVGNRNTRNKYLFVTSLEVKGQIIQIQRFFV